MSKLKVLRRSPQVQQLEDALGALALFVLLYVGLTLTGTA